MLSRRYYELVGDKGTYTRKKGLDREQNLTLLLNHIRNNAETGSKLEELCDVLPALPKTHVRSLVRTLQRRGQAYLAGVRSGARWFPGPEPSVTQGKPARPDGAS
jgi:ATP-dependent DNA helicase RecG